MKTLFRMLVVGAILSSGPQLFGQDTQPSPQQAKTFEGQITVKLNYLLFLPQGYDKDPEKKWPLILFLHGSGERGTDLNLVKKHGPPKILEKKPDLPFIIVSPQCPLARGIGWKSFELIALLDEVQKNCRVDPDRVYVTGLSMGGYGTWELAQDYPRRFAAIAPMCGGGNPIMARRLRFMSVWVFHGDADKAVPVEASDQMVDALKKAGVDVKYTRYPGVGHDCWTASYDNPELYEWFLAHRRPPEATQEGTRPATRPKN